MNHLKIARGIEHYFSEKIVRSPLAHTNMINAIDFRLGPSYNIIIACNDEKKSDFAHGKLKENLSIKYIPNIVSLDITHLNEN